MSHIAYLGLGTNLGDRQANLAAARAALTPPSSELMSLIRLLEASPIYETQPWGVLEQPAFLNQALKVTTSLPPVDLLAHLKDLEVKLGRAPSFRYGPRLIDIDILLYDDLILSLPGLEVPHPRLAERAFVLAPLADLAANLRHPKLGMTMLQLLKGTDRAGVVLFSTT